MKFDIKRLRDVVPMTKHSKKIHLPDVSKMYVCFQQSESLAHGIIVRQTDKTDGLLSSLVSLRRGSKKEWHLSDTIYVSF